MISIAASKLAIKVCRLIKHGGTTLPGKIAIKLYPGIIKTITKDFKIIMVTGTNGKTTTARIIGQILKENNIQYITNKSGANLVSGIVTTFTENVNLTGKSSSNTALIEIDEAAFNVICNYIEPDILVVTNFFRDQLDRYGELYSTLNSVKSGILKTQKTKLVLNADDSLCASIAKDTGRSSVFYGFDINAYNGVSEAINSDAMYCLYCKEKYTYSFNVYGHLGGFSCPSCGYSRPDIDISCTSVTELTSSYSTAVFSVNGENNKQYEAKINLPGLYNIYNSLAAFACSYVLGLPAEKSITALAGFECGFGRMETINVGNKNIKLILVKNPTGFNQVLNFLLTEDKQMHIAFVINDNLADGTDISWLWDVDFEKLQVVCEKLAMLYTSGKRAEDMAVRLKYSGIPVDKIKIIHDYSMLINEGIDSTPENHNFYILPTYTAMLEVRKVLKNKYKLKEFWK